MDRENRRKAEKNYGIGTSVAVIAFGLFWCIMAASIGAGFMVPFGLLFVGIAIYRLVMMLKVSKDEERPREPWDTANRPNTGTGPRGNGTSGNFCPYCGGKTEEKFTYCPNCGRRIG